MASFDYIDRALNKNLSVDEARQDFAEKSHSDRVKVRPFPCIYFFEFNGQYFSLVKLKGETRVDGKTREISFGHCAVLRQRRLDGLRSTVDMSTRDLERRLPYMRALCHAQQKLNATIFGE